MGMRSVCVFFIVCVSPFTCSVLGDIRSGTQLLLAVKMCEESPDAGRAKILAEPKIATIVGKVFSFESGGKVKARVGDGDLEVGTRVTGKFEPTENGAMRLAMKIGIGSIVFQGDDPSTDLVRTETIEVRTVISPGETKRLNCSGDRWCEISVEEVD